MLQVTVNQRYSENVTEYYTSTIIFPLLQTKGCMKRGNFALNLHGSALHRVDCPSYKSADVTCNMLQANCDYISRSE
jgi:hypothetical protein